MSLERCPGCRARLAEDPLCARCGCDFTLARQAQVQARRLLCCAFRAWVEGDEPQARRQAAQALALERSALAQALLKMVKNAR